MKILGAVLVFICTTITAINPANSECLDSNQLSSQLTTRRLFNHQTRSELNRLLQERRDRPENSAEIDRRIHRDFAQTLAVMVLDMSGFSKATATRGIIATLSDINQMNAISTTAIAACGGNIVKLEADNVYAVFPNVDLAVDASSAIFKGLVPSNIQVSIGVGYGELLMLSSDSIYGNDMYGGELNLAARLGEDLAKADELLLTEAAFQAMSKASRRWLRSELTASGVSFAIYKIIEIAPGVEK